MRAFILLFLFIVQIGFAQKKFIYTLDDTINHYFQYIAEDTATGDLFVNDMTFHPDEYHPKSRIIKLRSDGTFIDSLHLSGHLVVCDMVFSPSNKLLISIASAEIGNNQIECKNAILTFDKQLNLLGITKYDSTNQISIGGLRLLLDQSGFYGAYNNQTYGDSVILLRMDSNLVVKKRVSIPGEFIDFKKYGDSLLLMGRYFASQNDVALHTLCLSRDFNIGAKLSFTNMGVQAQSNCFAQYSLIDQACINPLGPNKYLVTGESFISNLNCMGVSMKLVRGLVQNNNQIYDDSIVSNTSAFNYNSDFQPRTSQKGNFVYMASISTKAYLNPLYRFGFSTKIALHKYDQNGSLVWINFYGGDNYYYPINACATQDGGVIVGGYMNDTAATSEFGTGFLMRFDKDGEIVETGIRENQSLIFSIYPNPTKDKVHFDFTNNDVKLVRVFDVMGEMKQEVNTEDINYTLDLSGYANGIYFVELISERNIGRSKIVVER